MSEDFKPNSTDAMFARLLTRMDSQDQSLNRIESRLNTCFNDCNKRVGSLENERWYQRGVVAAISVGAVGVWEFIKHRL
jgi:hypothetical protein